MVGRPYLAAVALAALAILSVPAARAQVPSTDLWRGVSVPCGDAVETSELLNGLQLFRAASDCAKQGREADGLFLLIVGQIRSQADISLLQPRDEIDELAASELYRAIYVRLGDPGPQPLYQNRDLISAVFERVDRWRPAFPSDYSPGWNYRASGRHTLYATVAREIADYRLAQLKDYALLAQDPKYAALELEAKALQARSPGGLLAGSKDHKRFMQLYAEMRRIAESRKTHLPALANKQSVLATLPPELDEGVKQIFTGLNGPEKTGTWTFGTVQEIRKSWLARAVTDDQLSEILGEVDFTTEVLVALAFGRRTTATGTLYVSQVSYNSRSQSWKVSGRIGVRGPDCDKQEAISHPFALAVAPKPRGPIVSTGQSQSNFGDGCKPPISAEATPE